MQIKNQKVKIKNVNGFTLVEMLVAISVFIIVVTISLGAVLSVLDAGRKAKYLKTVMTNLNFTLELMTREIKFGKNYYAGFDNALPHTATQDSSSGGSALFTFTNNEGNSIIYTWGGNQIRKYTDSTTNYIGITSPEVIVTNLRFYVFNSAPTPDTGQPRVVVIARGYVGSKPTSQSSFILQTTISQRVLDR
ncbi:MAG TPA: type II secretion system protein [Candidatus Paceibacterota bacterium]